jgi:chemotaxis protein methyltransferase CheR
MSTAGNAYQGLLKVLSRLPIIGNLVRRRAWYPYRHHLVLLFGSRQNYTFTQFVRLPHQGDALGGPVIDFLRPGNGREPLRVLIFGCSNGAEPYSMASILASRRPDLPFHMTATDIDKGMIEKALTARYTREEVTKNAFVDGPFLASTFRQDGESLEVRPELRARITFEMGDVLDAGLISRTAPADIVVAQNFLYHLNRRQARTAFIHLCSLLKPRAALFVDGMDIDLRQALSKKAGLLPLDDLIAEIHNDAMALRGAPWPWTYWGLEPLNTARKDWKQRYATIYLRDQPSIAAPTPPL